MTLNVLSVLYCTSNNTVQCNATMQHCNATLMQGPSLCNAHGMVPKGASFIQLFALANRVWFVACGKLELASCSTQYTVQYFAAPYWNSPLLYNCLLYQQGPLLWRSAICFLGGLNDFREIVKHGVAMETTPFSDG